MIRASNNLAFLLVLYSTTAFAQSGTLSPLHAFGSGKDGAAANSSLINVNGILYGTTNAGGAYGLGTIFNINPSTKTETVLYSFKGGKDGSYPGSLIYENGTIYGTTYQGGGSNNCDNGCGTLFSFVPSTKKETILHVFEGYDGIKNTDGANPNAPFLYSNNLIYSTTQFGGNNRSAGTIYSYNLVTKSYTVLYRFQNNNNTADGANPVSGLIDVKGIFYGTTFSGGNTDLCDESGFGCGTIYSFNPSTNTETVLHALAIDTIEGHGPDSSLLQVGTTLYGVTGTGGIANNGVIFAYKLTDGSYTVRYNFDDDEGQGDSALPYGALIEVGSLLYGTSAYGGTTGNGTVYSFNPSTSKETVLYQFTGSKDGANPFTSLLSSGTSILYGTTYGNASEKAPSTVFQFTLSAQSNIGSSLITDLK